MHFRLSFYPFEGMIPENMDLGCIHEYVVDVSSSIFQDVSGLSQNRLQNKPKLELSSGRPPQGRPQLQGESGPRPDRPAPGPVHQAQALQVAIHQAFVDLLGMKNTWEGRQTNVFKSNMKLHTICHMSFLDDLCMFTLQEAAVELVTLLSVVPGFPSHVLRDAHDVPHWGQQMLHVQWDLSCRILTRNEVAQHGLAAQEFSAST